MELQKNHWAQVRCLRALSRLCGAKQIPGINPFIFYKTHIFRENHEFEIINPAAYQFVLKTFKCPDKYIIIKLIINYPDKNERYIRICQKN